MLRKELIFVSGWSSLLANRFQPVTVIVHNECRIVAGAICWTKARCSIVGSAKGDSLRVKPIHGGLIYSHEGEVKAFVHANGAWWPLFEGKPFGTSWRTVPD